jgi:hypothetical protein
VWILHSYTFTLATALPRPFWWRKRNKKRHAKEEMTKTRANVDDGKLRKALTYVRRRLVTLFTCLRVRDTSQKPVPYFSERSANSSRAYSKLLCQHSAAEQACYANTNQRRPVALFNRTPCVSLHHRWSDERTINALAKVSEFIYSICFNDCGKLRKREYSYVLAKKLVAIRRRGLLERLYHKEDNHLLIFCVFSRGRSSNNS